MTEARLEIRMSKKEKDSLKICADECDISLSDYIRKKIFDDNCDLKNHETLSYESPSGAFHESLMGFTTKAIEALIYEVLKSQVGDDLAKEKLAQARKSSQNSLTKYGYKLAFKKDE